MRKLCVVVLFLALVVQSWAAALDDVGVTLLRTVDPTLTGANIRVAQPEANSGTNPPDFEVNPAAVGQPSSLFTYTSTLGSATTFPNSVGTESGHADGVGSLFYGANGGVAPQVAHVDNYDADYFYNNIIAASTGISAKIVNQSFIFLGLTTNQQKQVDAAYDNYASQNNVLFVSGAGNGGLISPPATSYNGIGVAVSDGSSSVGPTPENGRSKPDITAPGGATSFSAPLVSGAAAILMQAGSRGDGGTGSVTNNAADIRTTKALLLNGAIKPTSWTNGASTPLDARYGAGILNVFNSYKQLTGGKQTFIESTTVTAGNSHPPGNATNNVPMLSGWDFNTINTTPVQDRVNHYYFKLNNLQNGFYTLTATLVWNRQTTTGPLYPPNLNNLDLFLYNANGSLIASSASTVDNVEHLFLPQLPAGRYDLQVVKRGDITQQSSSETYALAFEIFTMRLSIARTNNSVVISWPLAPAGFVLQSTTNLAPPITWTNVPAPVVVTNNRNVVTLAGSVGNAFFRLKRP